MLPDATSIVCPHCFGQIDLEVRPPHKFPVHLSIICMTRGSSNSFEFLGNIGSIARQLQAEFVVGVDGIREWPAPLEWSVLPIQSNGYVESALNQLARHTHGQWILRLDDDESISPAMFEWLKERKYLGYPAWAFPTMALWGTKDKFIVSDPFWPDTHVRLTARHLAADWPDEPHGKPKWVKQAKVAPAAILHHKFLLKNYEERRRIADTYESKMEGGGHGRRLIYNCPEDVVDYVDLMPVLDGVPINRRLAGFALQAAAERVQITRERNDK